MGVVLPDLRSNPRIIARGSYAAQSEDYSTPSSVIQDRRACTASIIAFVIYAESGNQAISIYH